MTGLDLGSLRVGIEVDKDGAIKDLDGFKDNISKTRDESQSFMDKLGNAGKSIGNFGAKATDVGKGLSMKLTAPILAIGGGLIAMAKKSGDAADRLLDLHDITGLSTDSIQEWQHVSTVAGVSSEAMTDAVEGLVKRLPQLESEGGKATEGLEKLGLSFDDLKKMSPDEMMDTLTYAMADMEDPLERNAIGSQLFGGAWKDMAPILGNGSEALKDMRTEANDLGLVMSGDALNDANNFRVTMDTLTSTLKGAGNQIGAKLAPMIQDKLVPLIEEKVIPFILTMVDKIGELVDWFTGLSDETQKWIGIAGGIAVAIGPVLVVVGKLASGISSIISVITSMAGAMGGAGGAMALLTNPITLTIAAIVALIAIFVALYNTNDEFRENVNETWEGIKESISEFVEVVKELVSSFLDLLQEFWEEWGDTIMIYVNMVFDLMGGIFQTGLDLITDIFNIFSALFRGDWEGVWEGIKTLFSNYWKNITGLAQTYIDGVKNILGNVMAKIKEKWDEIWDGILTYLKDTWDNIITSIKNKTKEVKEKVKTMASDMIEALKNLPADALQMGKDFVSGMINGIGNMAGALKDKVTGMAKGALDSAKDFLGIKSPSREMMKVGEYTAEGFAEGIEDGENMVGKAIKKLTSFTSDKFAIPANVSSMLNKGSNGGTGQGGTTKTTNTTNSPIINIHIGSVKDESDITAISRALEKTMVQINRSLGVV